MASTGQRAERRAWWRRIPSLLMVVAGVLLALAIAVLLVLRWAGPRQALLERLLPRVEQSLGLRVEVADFAVRAWSTSLELRDLSLAQADSPPFLRADRAGVSLAPSALLTGRIAIRSLEAEGLVIDLAALDLDRLPDSQPKNGEPSTGPAIAAIDLELEAVRGLPLPAALAPWLNAWSFEGGYLRGESEGGTFSLELAEAALRLERPDRVVEAGLLSARLAGDWAGRLDLPELMLEGEGVDVRASGATGGEGAGEQSWQGSFDVDPAVLLAGVARGGRIRGRGELALPGPAAEVELVLADVPAEVVRPWLDPALLARAGAVGTRVGLEARAVLRPPAPSGPQSGPAGRLEVEGDLTWSRDDAELLRADFRTLDAGTGGDALRLRLQAALLPGASGRRALDGELALAPNGGSSAVVVERGEIVIEAPRLAESLADLGRYWPELVPAAASPPVVGSLSARIGFAGAIDDLGVEGEALWVPAERARVALTGAGRVSGPRLEGELEIEGLDPTVFGSPVGGTVDGRGGWRLVASDLSGGADLQVRLATAGRGLDASGRLDVALSDGVLEVDLSRLAAAGVSGRAATRIPLRSLGPLLARGPAPGSALQPPLEPLHFDWDLDAGSAWHELTSALAEGPATFDLTAGTRGELMLDPRFPTRSTGRVVVVSPSLVLGGSRVDGPGELGLSLDDGFLRLLPAALTLEGGELRLEATAELVQGWRIGEPLAAAASGLDLALGGRVPLAALVQGLESGAVEGDLEIDLTVAGTLPSPTVDLLVRGEGARAVLPGARPVGLTDPELEVRFRPGGPSTLRAALGVDDGRARLDLALPGGAAWAGAEARLELDRPLAEIERVVLPLRFAEGSIVSRGAELEALGIASELDLRLPLATLASLLKEPGWLPPLPAEAAGGPFELAWRAERADGRSLAAALGLGELPVAEADLGAALRIDPAAPTAAWGEVVVTGLSAVVEGRELSLDGPLRVVLDRGRLELEPSRLVVDGGGLEIEGFVVVDESWRPGRPPTDLVARLEARAEGELPASLLNPFLGGGRAEGPLSLRLELAGSPETLAGEILVSGPDATLAFLSPYATRFRDFDLDLRFVGGEAEIHRAEMELNEGRVRLSGAGGLAEGVALGASFEGVRFRLDYGLVTELSGALELAVEPEAESATLGGTVVVENGWLSRSIRIRRDLLAQILSPVDLTGTETSFLDNLELDLEVVNREGVRVDNNLADLWLRWEPLAVTGTVAVPVIEGRVEVDPGGLVHLFGQTVRIDRAVISYPGRADAAPTLDLETTTSLEDPTIGRLEGLDPLAAEASPPTTAQDRGAVLAAGVAGYYGEEIASRIAESLGASRLTVRPVLIFGEVDPSARLNIGRDLSSSFTLSASIDLRNAERQTYLLDVHEVPRLPSFSAQVFTTDEGGEGLTAQQRLEFGGTPRSGGSGPRIRRIETDRPEGISARAIRRATGFAKGDRLPDWGTFAAEVEVESFLRGKGYSDARVEIAALPVAGAEGDGGRVDLEIEVESGPRVEIRFAGLKMPRELRKSVEELYRADFFEEASLLEMERQAELALRSLGWTAPSARVVVERATGPETAFDRIVTVSTTSERRVGLDHLEIAGLPESESERLAARFPSRLQRVELAEALPAADRRLEESLAGLGWPDAEIVRREISAQGDRLRVEVAPGERLRLGSIRLEGPLGGEVPPEAAGLSPEGLEPGEPLNSDRLARAALALEAGLRDSGYVEARVVARLEPRTESGRDVDLVLAVDPGARRQLGRTRFEGLRSARPGWAAARADLASGEWLRPEEVRESRRRLYSSGRFSSVVTSDEPVSSDSVESRNVTDVVFEVRERPRFRLAYGLRWESEEGASIVVDAVDDSFLRRGLSLGARALYSDLDKSLRLSARWPFLLFNKGTLEMFALGRREEDEDLLFDTLESTLQFGYPLSRSDTVRVYGRYRDVHIYEEDPDPFFPVDIRVRNPFFGLQMIHDDRDDAEATSRGLFASADLSLSDELLASDLSYARFFGQVNLFRPAGRLLDRRLTWAQSIRVGYATAFKGQELRLEDRLYAGGEYSVRGYPRESLGPPNKKSPFLFVDEDALFVMNQELRFDLFEPVSGLVFLDLGNTWTGTTGFDTELFKSIGLGVRALTPVGLLRLDLAYPLDRRETDPAYKIYVGFGNVF